MASFGEELRRERELRDISLKEIAVATKISIRFLEALEQNHFDLLPGGIFNRGFIRAYARFIGVDGEEMVNAYLHEVSLRQARQGQGARAETPAAYHSSDTHAAGRAPAPLRPEARRQVREAGDDSKIEARQEIRLERRLTPRGRTGAVEGRTSVALWVLVVLAFLVGAGVLTLSLVGQAGSEPSAGSREASPVSAAPAQAPPATPMVAGVADGLRPTADTTAQEGEAAPTLPTDGQAAQGPEAGATGPAEQPPAPAEPVIPERHVRIVATETTRIRVECADKIFLDQELWPGQSKTLACPEPVLLSADNAGAVQYSIDGSPARLLGGVGEKVEGLVVAPTAPPPSRRRTAPAAPAAGQGSPDAGD